MPPADRTAWERLGRLLAGRRAQISPRYANRRAFAADREMNWRTLHDVELAKRDNFRPETMRAFEGAYMLVPGSLDRVLAGGDLEPAPPPEAALPALRPVPSSPAAARPAVEVLVALLARHPEDEGLAADVVAGLLSLYPDDDTMAAMAEVGLRRGKAPSRVVGEILEWLAFLDRAEGRPENGTAG